MTEKPRTKQLHGHGIQTAFHVMFRVLGATSVKHWQTDMLHDGAFLQRCWDETKPGGYFVFFWGVRQTGTSIGEVVDYVGPFNDSAWCFRVERLGRTETQVTYRKLTDQERKRLRSIEDWGPQCTN